MAELDLGEMISSSFNKYFKDFFTYLKVTIILYLIPQTVMTIFLQVFALGYSYYSTKGADSVNIGFVVAAILVLAFLVLVTILLGMLMSIAILIIIKMKRAGKNPSTRDIIKEARKYLGKYFGLMLLQGFALLGLYLLFIIPGIIYSVYWFFSQYYLILDNKSVAEAMKASKALVTGRWWTVLGYSFVLSLIAGGIMMGAYLLLFLPSMVLQFIPFIGPIISSFIQDALYIAVVPLGVILMEAFFQKLKVVKVK